MAGPSPIVVDASVAVKWFNPEEHSEQALALRDDHIARRVVLAAPSLLVWEVGNALRYSQELGSDDVKAAVRDLLDLQLALQEPDASWMDASVTIAFERGLTLYDASYVGLAEHLRAPLYTADARLLSTAEGVAVPVSAYGGKRR